jgi:hypothetical protein
MDVRTDVIKLCATSKSESPKSDLYHDTILVVYNIFFLSSTCKFSSICMNARATRSAA